MTRLAFIAALTACVVLMFLGILFLKDSYKLLPIQASQEFDPGAFANWRDFEAPSKKFRVMMPGLTQHAAQTVKDPKSKLPRYYDMYVAEQPNGALFMVSLITFPKDGESPETLQKTVVNDLLAANPTNELKNMKIGTYKQFKTLNFSIANSDMTVEGMTFVDKDTLYLLSAVFPQKVHNSSEFEYFVKSFDLMKEPTGNGK